MKLTIEETGMPVEPELVLRCDKLTPELLTLAHQLADGIPVKNDVPRIQGRSGEVTALLSPFDIYYFESVDDCVFAYAQNSVWQVSLTLFSAAQTLRRQGIVRVSKNLAVNAQHLQRLKVRLDGGLDGTLDNGERVVISRRYAKALRDYLKGAE